MARRDLNDLMLELKTVLQASADQHPQAPAQPQAATGAKPANGTPEPLPHELPLKFERLRNSMSSAISAKEDVDRRRNAERTKQWNDEQTVERLQTLREQNRALDKELKELVLTLNRLNN